MPVKEEAGQFWILLNPDSTHVFACALSLSLLAFFCSSVNLFLFLFADPAQVSAITTQYNVKNKSLSRKISFFFLLN